MAEQMAETPAECPSCGKQWMHVAPLHAVLDTSGQLADPDPAAEIIEGIAVMCNDCMDSGRWHEAVAREREGRERYEAPAAEGE